MKAYRKGIFISYNHKDRIWLDRIVTNLKPLTRSEEIRLWDDTKISPGTEWKKSIVAAIQSSRIAILLVTPDFLASDFIYKEELPLIEHEREQGGLIIYWIAVSHSSYALTTIGKLQAANDPQKPLDSLGISDQNKVLTEITQKIANAMDVSMVSNTMSIIDEFVPRQRAFLDKVPFDNKRTPVFSVQAQQSENQINFIAQGNVKFETITGEDMEKLDQQSRQLLKTYEASMQLLFDRWSELEPKLYSSNSVIRDNAESEMTRIRKDLCGKLTQILDFLESIGKHLQDHYHHVRFICSQ